jgi:hypothetical protein
MVFAMTQLHNPVWVDRVIPAGRARIQTHTVDWDLIHLEGGLPEVSLKNLPVRI